ncbi:U3 small nucleolar RNA-associated protein 6 [Colletotrichum tanaceti]|uniref:U3 small nucleolar RNA-associated protein 6 n=1 Tax=Colletotrichum tanaceti TaxID=1306861 RepID=A0A4U6XHJ4_9PEZI|nr:U3 small nucleolar RNA-associated protein 6 [Colletotrichum tanaceti]TKW55275.1 U3 small nucleolar RNA-associated protein 6 [Colletotrichum tanaceti]
MSVAEKARFYLERSVPQLREWEEKEIFTKDEIRTIVQKRSDFEHRILAPRSKPEDFSAYAKWEHSLETLRAKRCKRMKIGHVVSQHTSQARVLAIYERAVGRHPGRKDLWLEYLAYTADVKATKRWRRTMAAALRMMPTDADLWVFAGRRSASNGDMGGARGYFMRGCRFCTTEGTLWIEYARCEMEWLAKMEAKKGGAGKKKAEQENPLAGEKMDDDDEIKFHGGGDDDDDDEYDDEQDEDNALRLPVPAKYKTAALNEEDSRALKNNPALDGAIPTAIFDISRKQPFFGPETAERFFDMFAAFAGKVSSAAKIIAHVVDAMHQQYAAHPATWNCHIRLPLVGVSPDTPQFPLGLREVLSRLGRGLDETSDGKALRGKSLVWIELILLVGDLDEGIRAVLEHTKGKLQS